MTEKMNRAMVSYCSDHLNKDIQGYT